MKIIDILKERFRKQKSIEVIKDSKKLIENLEDINLGKIKVEVVNEICSKSIKYLSEKGAEIIKK